MTDTELLHEVEQAMLGAMITRPRRVGGLPGRVSPELFTDQRHQAIAAALTGTAGEERGLLGRLRGFFARFSRRTREDQEYLDTLPGLCPDAGHMTSYFEILREARDQREERAREARNQAADAARVLEGVADQLAIQTARTGRAAAPGELPEHVARQARALAGHARRLSQAPIKEGRQGQAAPAPQSQPAARWALAPQAVPPAQRAQAQSEAGNRSADNGGQAQTRSDESSQLKAGRVTREEAQDLLLAALMRDPRFAREAVASLPATLFDEGERRELFTMIGDFVSDRRPLDPLLVAWAADQRTAPGPDGTRNGWISPDYIRGIAALPAAPGNPAWLAKMLSNSSANSGERDQPEPRTAEVSAPAAPDQAPQSNGPASAGRETAASGPQRSRVPVGLAPAPELIEMPPPDQAQDGMTPRM